MVVATLLLVFLLFTVPIVALLRVMVGSVWEEPRWVLKLVISLAIVATVIVWGVLTWILALFYMVVDADITFS